MEPALELSQTRQRKTAAVPDEIPIPEPTQDTPPQSHILQVDFSWKKFKGLITSKDSPDNQPLYIVDLQKIKSPHLIFKHASTNETFGTGTLHPISIHADCTIAERKTQLKALKRFKTSYTHLSSAYSSTPENLVPMTWSSGCDFKSWDFVCLDDKSMPVAKFSANIWAVSKIGFIEFLGEKKDDVSCREEIVVTGLTLFYCMMLRTNNFFNLFGSVFGRVGPIKQGV
jgi:hypothetical protein